MSSYSWANKIFAGFFNHYLKLCGYFLFEVGLDLVDFGELGEGPASVLAEVVHAGDHSEPSEIINLFVICNTLKY